MKQKQSEHRGKEAFVYIHEQEGSAGVVGRMEEGEGAAALCRHEDRAKESGSTARQRIATTHWMRKTARGRHELRKQCTKIVTHSNALQASPQLRPFFEGHVVFLYSIPANISIQADHPIHHPALQQVSIDSNLAQLWQNRL